MRVSDMFHHQPQKPLDRAVFNINRTMKFLKYHDKYPAIDLSYFQYYLVDSIIFLLFLFTLSLIGLLLTTAYTLKTIWIAIKFGVYRLVLLLREIPSDIKKTE